MKYKYNCLNPIADCGLGNLTDDYVRTEKFEEVRRPLNFSLRHKRYALQRN